MRTNHARLSDGIARRGRLILLAVLGGILLSGRLRDVVAASPPKAQLAPQVRVGDRSVVFHFGHPGQEEPLDLWRSESEEGPFHKLTTGGPVRRFADLEVENGREYFYLTQNPRDLPAGTKREGFLRATPRPFISDDYFLEHVQRAAFDYFWHEANPRNGLIKDRSTTNSPCSIAAVGFGLTGLGIAIDHRWITREQGRERALATLKTFSGAPQGDSPSGVIGHRGWFYHFLKMEDASRVWNCELSTIDTALLLAGVIYTEEYFNGTHPEEVELRGLARRIVGRVDWRWMLTDGLLLRHGWTPEQGFLKHNWTGYNEGMILYLLALGADDQVPAEAWKAWTKSYDWRTQEGYSFINFPPLFGHHYSHCWVNFRHQRDDFTRAMGLDYFENSRRATLAQQKYCASTPAKFQGYSPLVWGITACDGPGMTIAGLAGYGARGAPPAERDDGTIAPTAVGGSLPFAPEICLPTLRHFYDQYRRQLWTPYGFRDAFNLSQNWWSSDVLGIDQGPILLMIENHRNEGVWKVFMRSALIREGLARAGFTKN